MKPSNAAVKVIDLTKKDNSDFLEKHPNVGARSARSNFSRLMRKARIEQEHIIITEHGEPAAAVIPITEFEVLAGMLEVAWEDSVSDRKFIEMTRDKAKELLHKKKMPDRNVRKDDEYSPS